MSGGYPFVDQTNYEFVNGRSHLNVADGDNKYLDIGTSSTGTAGTAAGVYLKEILVVPLNLNPGAVVVMDGTGSTSTVYVGGTAATQQSFSIRCGYVSTSSAWRIATTTNVQARASFGT